MRAFLLIASLCTFLAAAAMADSSVPQLMAQAQQAYLAGDYDSAIQLFVQVLEVDPQNTLAIQYMRDIRVKLHGALSTKSPLDDLTIPRIDFRNATFSAALDFLTQQAAKQSVTVSFVPQLPPEQLNRPVTLSLSQVPFLVALNYLCQLDNATYKVEAYAIVILPATPATAASAPQPPAPQ